MRRLYEPLYRLMKVLRIPKRVVFGSAVPLLQGLLDDERIQPGRAIDLGCGAGTEAVFLAKHGFDVVGVDRSKTAIELAEAHAADAGAPVEFLVDDVTKPSRLNGTFDLLIDIGTLNDLRGDERDRYAETVLGISKPGTRWLLLGFARRLSPDERVARFGATFSIETIADVVEPLFRRRIVTSLLTRRA